MDAPDFGDPEAWKIDAVRDGSVTYLRFPALDTQLPAGKSWVRAEDGQTSVGGLELRQLEQFTEADPRELLELLQRLSGEVETVGGETVSGVDTTHYRATLDASSVTQAAPIGGGEDFRALADQLLAQSGAVEVPVDIRVDGDGLVRKAQLDMSATQPGSSDPSRARMTFELWDLGERIEIEVPPASQVVDAATLKG